MDTMILTKEDGTTEEVEIVITFKLERFNNNDYVFYRIKDKYYGARFIEENGSSNLITDLSSEEKESLSEIFKKMHEGGII